MPFFLRHCSMRKEGQKHFSPCIRAPAIFTTTFTAINRVPTETMFVCTKSLSKGLTFARIFSVVNPFILKKRAMVNYLRIIILLLAALPLAFTHPAASYAKTKAGIQDVEVRNKDGILSIGFFIENCFTPKMEEAVLSGVPTTFHIRVVLENRSWLLFKSKIMNVTLSRTIKYDQLKKEFRLKLSESSRSAHTTGSFEEAREWMSRVNGLPLIPAWRLDQDKEYTLRVKAELSKIDLPVFLRYILFFVSLWDFETDWQQVVFRLDSIAS